jgi:hypothetical protein
MSANSTSPLFYQSGYSITSRECVHNGTDLALGPKVVDRDPSLVISYAKCNLKYDFCTGKILLNHIAWFGKKMDNLENTLQSSFKLPFWAL